MKTRSRSIIASVLVSALTLSTVGVMPGSTRLAFAEDKKPAGTAAPAPAKPAVPKAPAAPTSKPAAGAKPTTSAAATTTPDAKALTASGEKKFKASDFAGALADFQSAAALKDSPELERWIGQSHDNLNHPQDAVAAYEKFLAAVPKKMEKEGADTKLRVDAIKALPGHVKVTVNAVRAAAPAAPAAPAAGPDAPAAPAAPASPPSPPNAPAAPAVPMIMVDGSDKGVSSPADLELAAGHHKISARADGFEPGEREFNVAYAGKDEISIDLKEIPPPPPPPPPVVAEVPAPPPPPPPPPPPAERSKIPAYVTGGIAVVAAGVGTGFGIAALGTQSDFKSTPTTKRADDGENQALIADMCFGIAITFGVTSAVLFLSDNGSKAAQTTPSTTPNAPKSASNKPAEKTGITITPTPIVNAHGGGAGALIRF